MTEATSHSGDHPTPLDDVHADAVGPGGAQPTTLPALLRALDVDGAPVTRQKVAIRAWLDRNRANPALRLSLRRNGFGLLLNAESDQSKAG
jgi:hypothetical protein